MAQINSHQCDNAECKRIEHGEKLNSWVVAKVYEASGIVAISRYGQEAVYDITPTYDVDDTLTYPKPVLKELCSFQCLMRVVSPLFNGDRARLDLGQVAIAPADSEARDA